MQGRAKLKESRLGLELTWDASQFWIIRVQGTWCCIGPWNARTPANQRCLEQYPEKEKHRGTSVAEACLKTLSLGILFIRILQ